MVINLNRLYFDHSVLTKETFHFIEASIPTRIQNPMNWEKLKCILDNQFNLRLWPIQFTRDIDDTLSYLTTSNLTRSRSSTPKPSESITHKMFYCWQTSSMGYPPAKNSYRQTSLLQSYTTLKHSLSELWTSCN